MNKRDENDEKLKREWLNKNKVTVCPPRYLTGIHYLAGIQASRNFYELEKFISPRSVWKKGSTSTVI